MNIKWDVEYYVTSSGKVPAKDFIESLPVRLEAKVFRNIGLLEEFGAEIKMPYSKHLKEGVHELRVRQGNDSSRILYFFFRDQKIVLINGFIKKSKRVPPAELEKALRYKADHERRFSK